MKVKFTNPTEVTHTQLAKVVSRDDLRPSMCNVCLDIKNRLIVATDSYILIQYPIEILEETDAPEQLVVPVRYFNYLRYMNDQIRKQDLHQCEYILTDEYAEVWYFGEMVFRTRYVDVKYPNWAAVVPYKSDRTPIDFIGLSSVLLKRLMEAMPKTESNHMEFSFTGKDKAVLVETVNNDNRVTAIIMPANLNR